MEYSPSTERVGVMRCSTDTSMETFPGASRSWLYVLPRACNSMHHQGQVFHYGRFHIPLHVVKNKAYDPQPSAWTSWCQEVMC